MVRRPQIFFHVVSIKKTLLQDIPEWKSAWMIRPEIRLGYSEIQDDWCYLKRKKNKNKRSFWISTNSNRTKSHFVFWLSAVAFNICNKQSVVLVTYAVMVYAGKYDDDDDDDLTLGKWSLFTPLFFFLSPSTPCLSSFTFSSFHAI